MLSFVAEQKVSWDVAIDRLNGKYYLNQTRYAVNEYINKNKKDFEIVVHDSSFKKWLEANRLDYKDI